MEMIVAAACCSVLVSILLKYLKAKGFDVFQMIAWNYLSASLLCFYWFKTDITHISLNHTPWWLILILAVLLPSIFLCLAKSLQFAGILKTEIAQRLAVILSLLAAYFIFGEQFSQLKLIGAVSQEVLDAISEFKLDKYVNNLGYVSHKTAVEHQRKSQVLLLIEIDSEETKSIIPGKIFEYMVSERPIIAIGPEGSDFAEIIKNTNTGIFVKYDEIEKLKGSILAYYEEFKKGNLKANAIGLRQYSRKSLTEKLSKVLKSKI